MRTFKTAILLTSGCAMLAACGGNGVFNRVDYYGFDWDASLQYG